MQRHSARHVRNKSFHPPPESLSDDLTTDHHLVLTRNQGLTSNKTFGCVRIGSNLINFGFLWFSESVYKPDCFNGMAPNPLMRRPHGIPELVIFWEHRNIGSLGTLVRSSEEVSTVNELENPHSGGVFPGSQPPHIPKDKVTRHYISLRVFFGLAQRVWHRHGLIWDDLRTFCFSLLLYDWETHVKKSETCGLFVCKSQV